MFISLRYWDPTRDGLCVPSAGRALHEDGPTVRRVSLVPGAPAVEPWDGRGRTRGRDRVTGPRKVVKGVKKERIFYEFLCVSSS